MESRAKLFGHPIHQMLIVFPLGLLGMAAVFDLLEIWRRGDWGIAADRMILVGVVSAVVAALFGLIDWLSIPQGTRARRLGALHGSGNLVVVILFAIAWLMRRPDPGTPSLMIVVLEVVGLLISGVTGWMGGELVDRLGVGVHTGAHLDAPNSITHPLVDSSSVKAHRRV